MKKGNIYSNDKLASPMYNLNGGIGEVTKVNKDGSFYVKGKNRFKGTSGKHYISVRVQPNDGGKVIGNVKEFNS